MQDALLCYHIVMNMLHVGYFADIAKLLSQAWARCCDYFVGPGTANAAARSVADAPALFQDMEEWIQRLARLENCVTSMA